MDPGFVVTRKVAFAGIEMIEATTAHSFARHTHDNFGIGRIVCGAQRSLSGRGVVEAESGDLISVNPGEVHDGHQIGSTTRQWRMLYIDVDVVRSIMHDAVEGRTQFEFTDPVIRGGGLPHHLDRVFELFRTGELCREEIEESLLLLLAGLLGGKRLAAQPVPRLNVERLRTMIDASPQVATSLADLAREAGLSRFQTVRAFAKLTGLTPHAYILQRRVVSARRLIMNGTPLAEAAGAAGFADQSHLTRSFVRMYGMPPGQYARAVG